MVAAYRNDGQLAGSAPDGLLSSRALFRMNSEDIGDRLPTRQGLFRDNAADVSGHRSEGSPFLNMNDPNVQNRLLRGVYGNNFRGHSVTDGNADYENPEDEDSEHAQRKRLSMTASHYALNSFVDMPYYEAVVSFAKKELQTLQEERRACTKDMQGREAELRAMEEEELGLREQTLQAGESVAEAEEELKAAKEEKEAVKQEAETLETAKGIEEAKGGDTLVTKDGQKVELISGDSAGSKELRIVNEDGSLGAVVERGDVLKSDELQERKEAVPDKLAEADTNVTEAQENLARAQDINRSLLQDMPEVLKRMQLRRGELLQENSDDERRLFGIDRGIENMQKHIEYLESDDVQKKLASGELTVDELRQKIDNPLFWNKFSERHPEFKLEQTELDRERYGWWYKKQETAAASGAAKEARPELATGGDIGGGKINGAFASAVNGDKAAAPVSEPAPTAIVDATMQRTVKIGGLGL